jgi:preprotein translocase subunit SecE
MEKEKEAATGQFIGELFQAGLYKRNQGRITRQVTFGAIAVFVAVGCWKMSLEVETYDWFGSLARWLSTDIGLLSMMVSGVVLVLGVWIAYRLVNMPRFADFLISVEAEMNKVSWPTRPELIRASLVVLFTIFFLAAVLFVFDLGWIWLFQRLGVQPVGPGGG